MTKEYYPRCRPITRNIKCKFPITYILKNKGLKRYCDIYLRECQKIKSETAESIRSNITKIIKNTLRKYSSYIGKGTKS